MTAVPIWTHLTIDNIVTKLSSTGTAFENPPIYLWSVFFKVDGDTSHINPMGAKGWNLQGTATVVPTPGDQGDLPGGVQASYYLAEKTVIPASMGDYVTTLEPFSVPAIGSVKVGGMIVGWLGILFYHEDTPADAVTAGHKALNNGVQQALNNMIPTITDTSQPLTQADISSAESVIQSQVISAIKNSLSIWDKLRTFLNTEFQDTYIGTAIKYFTDNDLINSPPQGLPINYAIQWGGKLDPNLYVFTFDGTVLANFSPFSLRRVVIGLGYTLPVSLRAVMGKSTTPSLLAWIKDVT
jgi:hypothetical protein